MGSWLCPRPRLPPAEVSCLPCRSSAIVDAAGACPSAEEALLAIAGCSPLSELRQHCARTKATVVDTEARRVRIHQRRSLRAYTDAEGEWHLRARDNPEVGARIMAALDPIRDEIFRQARVQGRHEPPDAYTADALAEMASRSLSPDTAEATAGGGAAGAAEAPGSPVGADTADNTAGPTRAGATPAPRTKRGRTSATPKIIVRVDLEALLRGRPVEGEVSEIAGFGPVAVSAVRDMIDSDDPFLSAVVTKGQKVVGVAHLGRRPTARQQTALQWLYPSCANQACAAQARLDYDHRLDWARSHLTVLDLLDRLCSHCHALKTRNNWSLVEGRGKRPLVAPDDLRHPRHCVETRVNGPPG